MFFHSVKVPKLYKIATKIVEQVSQDNSSVKELVYSYKHLNTKALYALVVKTIQNGNLLDYLIRNILTKETRFNPWLARVLITELIWGSKHLPQGSKPCDTILKYKDEFINQLETAKNNPNLSIESNTNTVIRRPRFVRVNTLKITVKQAINTWTSDGWTQIFYQRDNYDAYLQAVASLGKFEFIRDIHIKELFAFYPKTEFHTTELYKDGSIILQDKASCIPAFVLNPPAGSQIMDLCAAPGMKTSHLAAIINNTGKIYAFEKSVRRFNVLKTQLDHHGVICAEAFNMDCTLANGEQYPNVEYILLDPSCSGSGKNDIDSHSIAPLRIESLVSFQIAILRHALTRFPNVKKIVYSTCSSNSAENEKVLAQGLNLINANGPVFELVPNILPHWKNFGDKELVQGGEHCLYAKPESDQTGDFFVALLKRVGEIPIEIHNVALSKQEKNKIINKIIRKGEKSEKPKKKKLKKRKKDSDESDTQNELNIKSDESPKKKRKKSILESRLRQLLASSSDEEFEVKEEKPQIKSLKKKRKKSDSSSSDEAIEEIQKEEKVKIKKKKNLDLLTNETNIETNYYSMNKRKTLDSEKAELISPDKKGQEKLKIKKSKKKSKLELTNEADKETKKKRKKSEENELNSFSVKEEMNEIQEEKEKLKIKKKKKKKNVNVVTK